MTASKMHAAERRIGTNVIVSCERPPMRVICRVLDVRYRYGRIDYRVEPVMGLSDSPWVQSSNVTLIKEAPASKGPDVD